MNKRYPLVRSTLLTSRDQYETCHILLPGDDQVLGAICLNHKYYGFYKQVVKAGQLLRFMLKLRSQPAEVLITQSTKGYFLWLWEPDAKSANSTPSQSTKQLSPSPSTFYLLEPPRESFCQIRVPDLDQVLSAIKIVDNYYSLFKLESDTEIVMEIIAKLTQRGDEVAVGLTRGGYAICVLEPDASVVVRR